MLSFLVATLLGFPLSQPDRRGVLRLAGAALASSPAARSASAAITLIAMPYAYETPYSRR